ncbi:hypothetical protein [Methylobacterium segetis]|uniref:hypothetical protein n=1 Tax=Methylobacterium segetis TaxID=2488750 RepID=UPI001050A191|nr:hypothetical protein [Methylobacterium segetis]
MRLPLLAAFLLLAGPLTAAAQVDPSPNKRRPIAPSAAGAAQSAPATPEEMEARRDRADTERKLQEKAFDDRVRRATTSICSGCMSGAAAAPRRSRGAAPAGESAPADPAEAPPRPAGR